MIYDLCDFDGNDELTIGIKIGDVKQYRTFTNLYADLSNKGRISDVDFIEIEAERCWDDEEEINDEVKKVFNSISFLEIQKAIYDELLYYAEKNGVNEDFFFYGLEERPYEEDYCPEYF